jgi:nucleotide-binding universal stress UspA family protein
MPDQPVRRIVVATDFSGTADRGLDVAITMARALGAQLTIVHVTQPAVVLPPPLEMLPTTTLFPDLPRRVQDGLAAGAVRAREAGVKCETVQLSGSAASEIVGHAKDTGADMLVMGTHGHGGLAHAVMGSVTERVVHGAPCPVLVVPRPH